MASRAATDLPNDDAARALVQQLRSSSSEQVRAWRRGVLGCAVCVWR
jgi:hypothetical protein